MINSTSAGQRQAVERDYDPVEPERAQQVQGQADRRSQGKYTIHSRVTQLTLKN